MQDKACASILPFGPTCTTSHRRPGVLRFLQDAKDSSKLQVRRVIQLLILTVTESVADSIIPGDGRLRVKVHEVETEVMPPRSYTGKQRLPHEASVIGTRSRAYESFSVLSDRKSSVFEAMRHIKVIRQGSPATSMQTEPLPARFLLLLMS